MLEDYKKAVIYVLEKLGNNHSRRQELELFRQRLFDNIKSENLFGSTQEIRAERARIIYQINSLCLDELKISFNDILSNIRDIDAD